MPVVKTEIVIDHHGIRRVEFEAKKKNASSNYSSLSIRDTQKRWSGNKFHFQKFNEDQQYRKTVRMNITKHVIKTEHVHFLDTPDK